MNVSNECLLSILIAFMLCLSSAGNPVLGRQGDAAYLQGSVHTECCMEGEKDPHAQPLTSGL